MNPKANNTPTPEEVQKKLAEFMKQQFGEKAVFVGVPNQPEEAVTEAPGEAAEEKPLAFEFNFKPKDIKVHLDRFVIRQDEAKKVLSIAVCDHYNHVKLAEAGKANPKFKTLSARAYLRPIKEGAAKGLGLGGYAQYAPRAIPSGDNNDVWFGGHAFFEASMGSFGLAYDTKKKTAGGKDVTAAVISGTGRYRVTEKDEIFARVDVVDFDTDSDDVSLAEGAKASDAIDKRLAQTVMMAGVAHSYSKTLRSIVDISARSFQDKLYVPPPAEAEIKAEIRPDTEIVVSFRFDATL